MFENDARTLNYIRVRWARTVGKAFMMNCENRRKICRLCLKFIELDNFIELRDVEDLITKCAPEVDVYAIDKPIVCETCLECLNDNYKFFINCLEVEKKLDLYFANSNVKSPVNVFDVLHFAMKPKQESIGITSIKYKTQEESIKKDILGEQELVYENNWSNNLVKEDNSWQNINTENERLINIKTHESLEEAALLKCDKCCFKTKRKYNLRRHTLVHQNKEETVYFQCDKCDYKTKHKDNIKLHDRGVHKIPIIFNCHICIFRTEDKIDMEKHKLMHKRKGDRKFVSCDKCTYKAKYQSTLNRHMLRHTKPKYVKYFQCNNCVYKTTRKHELTKHMMLHRQSDVTASCDKCSYQTKSQSILNRHKLKHEKPEEVKYFKCDRCNYKTRRNYDFKKHLMLHPKTEGVVFLCCDKCNYKSRFQKAFIRHRLRHKNGRKQRCVTSKQRISLI